MLNLTVEQRKRVDEILTSDRQWHRHVRIGHAKRMLKLAYASQVVAQIAIRQAVFRRLNYDWIDKASAKERP